MSILNISLDAPLNLQTRWPTVSRGGAYCGGHLAAQLVFTRKFPTVFIFYAYTTRARLNPVHYSVESPYWLSSRDVII